jgi:hypothetical protein
MKYRFIMKKSFVLSAAARAALAALAAAVLVFTGCGGDDKNPTILPGGGDPALTGTVDIGTGALASYTTVTAAYSGGNGTGTPSYVWELSADGSDPFTAIAGETNASYYIQPGDVGKHIRAQVSYPGFTGSIASNVRGAITAGAVPTVTTVTVSPSTVNVAQGLTQQFTATVTGTNSPPTTVTWTLVGGTSTISSDGLLTVNAAETIASTITVKATSTLDTTKNGTATVTVTSSGGDPALTGTVSITPTTPTSGTTVTAAYTPGNGTGTPSYVWQSGNTTTGTFATIAGATSASYSIPAATYDGKYIRVQVSFSGNTGSVTSVAVGPVTAAAPTWTAVTTSQFGSTNINGIAYGNSTFVAVGWNGKMAYSSDGETWTAVEDSKFGSSGIMGITYGNSTFVAVGQLGKMAYSSNGETWTAVTTSQFGFTPINGIAYGNSTFVAVGDSGKMAYSSDGETWTAVTTSKFGADWIFGIAYGTDKFVAVGDHGKMAYSSNGITWTAVGDSTFGSYNYSIIRGIAYGNNKFVAVGTYGKIAYSN